MQGAACRSLGQFGAQLADCGGIVAVLAAFDHHQGVGIALPQQVFDFVDFIGGVHRHQHRAQLGGGPEGDVPCGNIGGPDGNLSTCPYPQGDQRPGAFVHVVPELAVGAGVIQGGVFEGVLVGKLLHHAVQHVAKGAVDQRLLGPYEMAGVQLVAVQRLLLLLLAVAAHEARKVGKDHRHVVQVVHPGGVPFQGDKAVVVQGIQGFDQRIHGQIAFADELIGKPVVLIRQSILDVDVPDVRAQVGDGNLRAFPMEPIGKMKIPQRRQGVAGIAVQQVPQPGRIGIYAHGLDQQHHARLLCQGQGKGQRRAHQLLAELALRQGGVQPHMGGMQPLGCVQTLDDFLKQFPLPRPVAQVHRGVDAGNGQPPVIQGAVSGRPSLGVRRTALAGHGGGGDAVDLNPLKAQVRRRGQKIVPAGVMPALGGKTQPHASFSSYTILFSAPR